MIARPEAIHNNGQPRNSRPDTNRLPSYDFSNYAGEFKARIGPLWLQAVLFAAGHGPPPNRPHQVEVHARQQGRPACLCRCVECCGRFLFTKQGLPPAVLCRLFNDLIDMGVSSVVLSGNHTDPACLDTELLTHLIRTGGPAWGIKLYTFGLRLDRSVQHTIIEAAERGPHRGSYISFSKLTTDPEILRRMCRPCGRPAGDALRIQEENLCSFFDLATARGFPLSVSLNCRLTRINGAPESLADLLGWFVRNTPPAVRLRITTDYAPVLAPEVYRRRFFHSIYLPPREAHQSFDRAARIAALTPDQRERITFRAIPAEPKHDVGACFSRLLFAAVSPNGLIFPCPGIAGARMQHVAYGDLKKRRFPQIWSDFVRNLSAGRCDPIRAGCPHCATECDRQVCRAIAAEAESLSEETGSGRAPGQAA